MAKRLSSCLLAVGVIAGLGISAAPLVSANGAADRSVGPSPDHVIVSQRQALSPADVRASDVTDMARGAKALENIRQKPGSIDVNNGIYRVFVFPGRHELQLIIGASTPFEVFTGLNAAGEKVYEVESLSSTAPVPANAGYAVPPSRAFNYHNDGQRSETVGSWHRDLWWSVAKANNWKACRTCTRFDYYRYYAKMRAGVLQAYVGSGIYGYKRAWAEINRNDSGWTSPLENEAARPLESYQGQANQTVTVGFGSSFGINIGVPPISAGGSVNSSYGGSMTRSSENWHPVIRSEVGSGGVQWCRYTSAEFEGTKTISARTSVRVPRRGSYGGFRILMGMSESTKNCPSQI